MKSAIALDDFTHAKAMQELSAMRARMAMETVKRIKATPRATHPVKRDAPQICFKRVPCWVETGKAFRKYRTKLEIESRHVYKRAGIDRKSYYDLERGRRQWTKAIREKVVNAITEIVIEREQKQNNP